MYSYNKYPFSFAFYSVKEKEIGRLWLKLRFCPVWFYSVHSVLYSPFQFIQSILPLWSYLIQYSSIRSTLVLFGPLWYYSVYFGSIRSICSIWSILCTLVLCGPLLFPFSPMWSIRSYSAHFCSIWSHSIHFLDFFIFSSFFSEYKQDQEICLWREKL